MFRVGETRASVTKYAFFPVQDERRLPAHTFQGPLATPLEPLIASSVWGTRTWDIAWRYDIPSLFWPMFYSNDRLDETETPPHF